jgi:serine/threonine-protein kinase HipA
MLAGQLFERNRDDYEFAYNVQYLADSKTPAIALSLPKREKPYRSSRIFPFFTNLLPEGSNRKAMCANFKVDDNDFFGMLEMICGMDCIGNVTLRKEEK